MFTRCFLAVVVALVVGCCGASAYGAGYQVTSLEIADPLTGSACDINDSGQILINHTQNVYIWEKGSLRLVLSDAVGLDMNNAGDVVGEHRSGADSGPVPYMLHDGVVTELGCLPGWDRSPARAINNLGQVIGTCGTSIARDDEPGYIWQNGKMTDLGSLSGFTTVPTAINDAGQVVGASGAHVSGERAFVWKDGVMSDLQSLPNSINDWAFGINNNGDIAGCSSTEGDLYNDGQMLPCLWVDGNLRMLPVLAGYWGGEAIAINDSGLVIGTLHDTSGETCPVYWQDGVCHALPTLGGTGYVRKINNKGQIVGCTNDSAGVEHVVLWEPVPEPSSIFAMITGLVGIGGIAIRRKR